MLAPYLPPLLVHPDSRWPSPTQAPLSLAFLTRTLTPSPTVFSLVPSLAPLRDSRPGSLPRHETWRFALALQGGIGALTDRLGPALTSTPRPLRMFRRQVRARDTVSVPGPLLTMMARQVVITRPPSQVVIKTQTRMSDHQSSW